MGVIDAFELVEIDYGEQKGAVCRMLEAGFQVAEQCAAIG